MGGIAAVPDMMRRKNSTWPFPIELHTDTVQTVGFKGRICVLFVFGPPMPSTMPSTGECFVSTALNYPVISISLQHFIKMS